MAAGSFGALGSAGGWSDGGFGVSGAESEAPSFCGGPWRIKSLLGGDGKAGGVVDHFCLPALRCLGSGDVFLCLYLMRHCSNLPCGSLRRVCSFSPRRCWCCNYCQD
ncbi:unnamed protein product [Urochloa humidicola]